MKLSSQNKSIRVLLVAGQSYVELVEKALANDGASGHELVAASSLAEARQEIGQGPFDVILLDLDLPDGKALGVFKSLQNASSQTPVVVLALQKDEKLYEQLRQLGAQDFLCREEMHPLLISRVLRFVTERADYLRRLRISEKRTRRMVEKARDVIYRTDRNGNFVYINPAVETVTGYQPEELLGKSFLTLIPTDNQKEAMEHYRRQREEAISSTYLELPIKTKSGRERWVGQHVWLASEKGGKICFEAIARDITDLKYALRDLEQSRQKLEERVKQRTRQLEEAKLAWERTFDAVPDLVLITDSDMRITRVNRAVSKYMGKPAQQLLGLKLAQAIPGMAGLDALNPYSEASGGKSEVVQEVHDEAADADFLISSALLPGEDIRHMGYVHVARDITELKRAERTVKEQLNFLQVLIEAIPNPVFFKDKEGMYTGCNRAFQSLMGVRAEDIRGASVNAVLDRDQAELFAQKDRELLREGGVQVFETQLKLPGRSPLDVINSKAVIKKSSGEVDGLVGVILDITELRAAERALRASEEQFRSLFEQAPISLWEEDFSLLKKHLDSLTETGCDDLEAFFEDNPEEVFKCASLVRVVNVNTHTLDLFGAKDKQEMMINLDKIFTEESLPAFKQEFLALYNGARAVSLNIHNRSLAGHDLYLLINATIAPGSERIWDRVLVSIQDLTERLESEAALRESEKRYRKLVEALSEGLVQVDQKARIKFCNKRFVQMTGYSESELLGSSIFEYLDQKNAEIFKEQLQMRVSGREDNYELSFLSRSGQPVDTLVSPRAIFDAERVYRGAYALVTDITDRKKLELQLRQSQKMEAIGQLAAGIAHEINTPTQYVVSNSHFLQEGFLSLIELQKRTKDFLARLVGDSAYSQELASLNDFAGEIDLEYLQEEIPEALEANIDGLNRIAVIVRSMRDFAHPGMENKEPVNLNQVIENTVTVARNEWKYVADLETDLDPELPMVDCVSNEIKQALLNIVVNAAQAIGEVVTEGVDKKGLIKIASRADGAQAVITISDSGPGIPSELSERVFDPFFTTKDPGKGTGQGLAIAYRAVVDNHGGSLSLKSYPGGGAVFEISLPLKGGGSG